MAFLKIMSGEAKGRRFEIDRDRVVIGRSSENAIVLPDTSVSGKHCEILRDGRRFTLRDLGSTNGTRLNDVGIREYRLSPKDVVHIGTIEAVFDGDDVEPFSPGVSRIGDTQVTVRLSASELPGGSGPPAFGTRRDRRWAWAVPIAIVAAGAGAALALFLYRLFFS